MGRRQLPPRLQLYGPDDRYGAKPKRGFKRYVWYIVDGRTETPTNAGRTEADVAARALSQYIRDRAAPARRTHRVEHLSEAITEYAAHKLETLAYPNNFQIAAKNAIACWGDVRIAEIGKAECTDYVRWRRSKPGRFGTPPTMGTVRHELLQIRTAINFCIESGYCKDKPEFHVPKGDPPRELHLSRQQIAVMLRETRRIRDPRARRNLALAIRLAVYTGARSHSIRSLTWRPERGHGHIDLAAGVIDFRRYGMPQTNKRRAVVPIPRRLRAVLEGFARRHKRFVFESWTGGHPTSFWTGWNRVRRAIGMPDLHFHDLSHTAVTWLAARRVHPKYITQITGKSEKIANSVYLHMVDDELAAAINGRPSHPRNDGKRR